MEELDLGPNGGLMYALELLDKQGIDLFIGKIEQLINEGNYLLFDCPGQVELFTHHNSLYRIFKTNSTQTIEIMCCIINRLHLFN